MRQSGNVCHPTSIPVVPALRGTTCMRHLVNTFLDGGETAEKSWLEPILAPSLDDAPGRLRLSADVTKMLHALAKCLGEGIGLYGKGDGAKNFRPWLELQHKDKLYWHLERVDKARARRVSFVIV